MADLAALNVKQCVMRHDQCRNTDAFRWAGQNLHTIWSSSNFTNIDTVTRNLIQSWFSEHVDTTLAHIDQFPSTSP